MLGRRSGATQALPTRARDVWRGGGRFGAVQRITVFTDGACSGNPGPGGWGWAVAPGGEPRASGGERSTTNQRMELYAALDAIRVLGADGSPLDYDAEALNPAAIAFMTGFLRAPLRKLVRVWRMKSALLPFNDGFTATVLTPPAP